MKIKIADYESILLDWSFGMISLVNIDYIQTFERNLFKGS